MNGLSRVKDALPLVRANPAESAVAEGESVFGDFFSDRCIVSLPASAQPTGVRAPSSRAVVRAADGDTVGTADDVAAGGTFASKSIASQPASDLPAFSELGLPTPLLRALRGLGYHAATAIQAAAVPAMLAERDVIGVAQTGTGKTAAFGLPLLASIDPGAAGVQSLVLVPTRELAVQVTNALDGFAAHMPAVATIAIYGGAPMGKQIGALRRGAQVVVGTPGRVIDLIDRGALDLSAVRFVALDEADEMLHMGFAEDVDRILSETPKERQTALFSATMPTGIRRVASRHLRNPVDVSVSASATPVARISQQYVVLPYRDKLAAVERVLAVTDADAAVVFVRTRSACEELGARLVGAGINAAVISGDVSQDERERTIGRLRAGQVDVLVATDVAARGMDVERIGLVVNFDAPADPEIYTHRIGRTGRAGRSGAALTFLTPKELAKLAAIERATGRRPTLTRVPTADEVHEHQASRALAAALERHGVGRLHTYRDAVRATADIAGVSVEELAAALLATMVGDDGSAPLEIVEARPRRGDDASGTKKSNQPARQRFAADRDRNGTDRDRPRGDWARSRGDRDGARFEKRTDRDGAHGDRDRPRADRDRPRDDRGRAPKYEKRPRRDALADGGPRWQPDRPDDGGRHGTTRHGSAAPKAAAPKAAPHKSTAKHGPASTDRGTARGAGKLRHRRSVA